MLLTTESPLLCSKSIFLTVYVFLREIQNEAQVSKSVLGYRLWTIVYIDYSDHSLSLCLCRSLTFCSLAQSPSLAVFRAEIAPRQSLAVAPIKKKLVVFQSSSQFGGSLAPLALSCESLAVAICQFKTLTRWWVMSACLNLSIRDIVNGSG